MSASIPPEIHDWFTARGWRVRRHQAEMLAASDAGRHALLVADTGAGKTLAGFLPTLCDFAPTSGAEPHEGLHTLYVSPLKALAHAEEKSIDSFVAQIDDERSAIDPTVSLASVLRVRLLAEARRGRC